MSYTLKTHQISVKDPATGQYSGVDILAEQTEQGLIAELQAEGTTQVNRIGQAAIDVQAAVDKAESDAAGIISETQQSINTLEREKNAIAATVASMAKLGTDATLSTPGMAADAAAVGELNRHLSDETTAGLDTKAPAILETASGAIASFDDGADGMPVKKLVAQIEPVQDLHGYDNPWPGGGGTNKWDEQWEVGNINSADGQNRTQNYSIRSKNYISVNPNETYCLVFSDKYRTVHTYIQVAQYDDNKQFISMLLAEPTTATYRLFTVDNNAHYIRFSVGDYQDTKTGAYYNDIAVNYPSTVTTYSPYSNICPISGWTEANIYQASLPKGYTYANYITVNNAINIQTDIDFNAHDIEVICVHQPLVYKQYGWIYSAGYKEEAYNVTRLILNTGLGTYLFNNASRANSPGSFSKSELSFIKTVNRFGSIDVNNRTITGSTNSGSNTDGTAFSVGGTNMSVRYKYIIVKKTDASGGKRLLVLVACRNADGIAGLYDLVNGAFWTTASSSDITATGDAPSDLSVLYNATLPINWEDEAGTVYGGTVTLNQDGSADLKVTKAITDLGTLSWTKDGNVFYSTLHKRPDGWGITMCDSYAFYGHAAYSIIKNNIVSGQYGFSSSSAYKYIIIRNDSCTTAAEIKAALNGVKVFYQILPQYYTSYHLPNVGQLKTFLGVNSVWCDTGDIAELVYPADTKLFLTARDEEITGNIAPIENGTTARKAYAQGAYFWHDTKFCKALTAIASGATFTLGTNYQETTVAAELLAAQN